MKNIVIFASGNGSNAENICKYFSDSTKVKVVALFCNNPGAGVFERIKKYHILSHLFTKKTILKIRTFFFLYYRNIILTL